MRITSLIIFLVCFTIGLSSSAQIIEGNVSDKNTGEPIPFANVFFSGTLIGATTDLEGNFSFIIPAEGKYELIVSYVGYQEFSQPVLTSEKLPFFQVALEPKVIALKDIHVNADTSGWKNNYPIFKQLFLGETANAAKVDISNPRDIFLFFDPVENGLYAHSRKEILIDNKALGYRIGYVMQEFRMEYKSHLFYSFGIPRFEEMKPKGKGQIRRWEKARETAYRGSFNHFLRSFKNNTFVEEDFIVQELYRVPNRKRPPQKLIDEKLSVNSIKSGKYARVQISGTPDSDSLNYWVSMQRMPSTVDSLGKVIEDNSLIQNGTLKYKGHLRITYTKENEDLSYSRYRRGGGSDTKQTSTVYFNDFLTIYDNGYYDVKKVFFEGYMGWSAKIAEMLPLEYTPSDR
ncbi:carboxypeptidase-like regulatory domain-containing protein [Ekhidna sp. To15]|uniref:carboxypeptidase-like regulatory domain-containing protein n=1 Tax=Ekhidna sp. To15 TaxID=3395267 RepID=UPI003F51B89C